MNAITVTKRTNDYLAHVTGDKARWDCGATIVEAIGALVLTWPEKFGLSIVLPDGSESPRTLPPRWDEEGRVEAARRPKMRRLTCADRRPEVGDVIHGLLSSINYSVTNPDVFCHPYENAAYLHEYVSRADGGPVEIPTEETP